MSSICQAKPSLPRALLSFRWHTYVFAKTLSGQPEPPALGDDTTLNDEQVVARHALKAAVDGGGASQGLCVTHGVID